MHFRKIYVFAFCVMFTILVTSCGADNQTSEININNITENKTENKTEKEISGIVALNAYRQNSKMVYEIYSINPESGETELFSTFSDDTSEEYVHDKWFSYDQWGSTKFSSDYLKMAKDEYGSGGHQFAGWVDSKNNFINVYKEIFGEPESDFYTITSKAYGFDSNDYFYFNVDGKYYKVPSDNLSKDALIDISDKVSYSFDKGYYSVDSYILTGDSSTIHNLYEMWGSSDYIVTDCLESRVLGFEAKKQYEQVYVPRIQDYIDTEDISYIKLFVKNTVTGEEKYLFNNVSNRYFWSGVFSPDNESVAFLASGEFGDKNVYNVFLYTVPIDDYNPSIVNTDLSFTPITFWNDGWGFCKVQGSSETTLLDNLCIIIDWI